MTRFLGLDVSTTAVKALLVNGEGAVLASASVPHPLSTPKPLWAEQDPELWWQGAQRAMKEALAKSPGRLDGIGLTGQMHGLVLLDKQGKVLRPAILWNDQRTGAECDEIRRRLGKDRLIRITGNDALTGFTAPKLLWVRRHEPEVWAKTARVLLPKDYVRYKLTGTFATDKADGSGTLLMDLAKRSWSDEVLSALEIPRAWLPDLFEGPEETGRWEGAPVAAGAGDQAAQALGAGLAVTVGTSGVVFAPCDRPLVEPEGRLHAFCHALPGQWHLMGVMLSAAGSLQWHRDTLAPGMPFDALVDEAASVPPGSEGLTFLPYLSGERTPHADPLARGAWVGLTLRHGRGHLTRSVLEGVAFGLRDCLDLVRQAGIPTKKARLSGGGAKSALWRQILADVLEMELEVLQNSEGAAYGAAVLAGAKAKVNLGETVSPDAGKAALYRERHAEYRALYPALRKTHNIV